MKRAFSLVELSIVLVILGLLVGGVLSGQSLIHAAELRSVSTESNKFYTALSTFRDKFFALPGDMSNATSFWGKDNANCGGQAGSAATPGTCNGDGDGILPMNYLSSGGEQEPARAWQQLALSGLIEGVYSGVFLTNGTNNASVSIPKTKINSSGGWWFDNTSTAQQGWNVITNDVANTLVMQQVLMNGSSVSTGGVMNGTDAWNIDTKIDDGKPGTGKLYTYPNPGYCTTTNDPATAVYSYTRQETWVCWLFFKLN